jgi:preprotein translocase subunit SecA
MKILELIFGNAQKKELDKKSQVVARINAREKEIKKLSDAQIKEKTTQLKKQLEEGKSLNSLLVEAFAVAREAAWRVIGERPYDVQLIGAMALHEGKIAEMKTGEGKTLSAVLAVYLNALSGKGVHVVTVNDYLSRRDANWMGSIYNFLGLSTACLNHDRAYLYQPKKVEQEEGSEVTVEMENLIPVERKEAYAADVMYATNNELGFDYLRDNMAQSLERLVQRPLNFAIVDEVDSILIDEARTPLIISAPDTESTKMYQQFASLVPRLKENEDYNLDEKMRSVVLTNAGIEKIEKWLGMGNLYETSKISYVHHLEQALKAHVLFKKDRDYVIKEGEVVIVDEFTGRLMPGRRYSEGLHQAIEAKEGVAVQKESRTLATITFQNFFRMYDKLAGMTGTAATSAEEFEKVYKLEVLQIPTNKPTIRDDRRDVIYKTEPGKMRAITEKVAELNKKGQPVLVGTIAIEKSEELSAALKKRGVKHEVLNAKNHAREAQIIARAGQQGAVTIATNMAGRGTDIKISKEVKKLGGLFILGSERHEARRIDNQLRGRAGRQGDPGASQFFVSLEDELLRRFGGDRLKSLMSRLGLPEDEPIENKLISRSIESAQTKIEGFNFDTRKRILEYDDVMNKQREAIYRRRKEILEKDSVHEQVLEMINQEWEMLVGMHTASENEEEWNTEEIAEEAVSIMGGEQPELHQKLLDIRKSKNITQSAQKKSAMIELLQSIAKQELGRKEKESPEQFRHAEKNIYLQTIDSFWMEHLDQMDYLRGSIGFQGYGQRDPLIMYKKEAYNMFQNLLDSINKNVVKAIFKVKVVEQDSLLASLMSRASYSGGERPEQFAASEAVSAEGDGSQAQGNKNHQQAAAPIVSRNQVGRNEPCPCGSGKKYKKCCGREA